MNRASAKTCKIADTTTVAGVLESAILSSKGVKKASSLYLSSRTDAGVHALHNTAHIDIEWHHQPTSVNPQTIKKNLNNFLRRRKVFLCILDVIPVSSNFSARYCAEKRVYIYRIAVGKSDTHHTCEELDIPVSEWGHCYFIQPKDFNLNALKETLLLFPGIHNFSSFIKQPNRQERSPMHFMYSCSVSEGRSAFNSSVDPAVDSYSFLNVSFEGKSFGYQQIRRMLSAALAVAEGKLTLSHVQHMLNFPSATQSFPNICIVPAYALYLKKVHYNPEEFSLHRRSRSHPYYRLIEVIDQFKSQLLAQLKKA